MQNVTVVGLGIIGNAWAKNLHADGLKVRGWNRTPKNESYFERDLARAVTGAEMIIVVVSDPAALESVFKVIVPQLKPGQLVVQSSTISAHWTKLFAQQIEATGAVFLEAPFTGSKLAAEARETVFFLGGSTETAKKAAPVLDRLSKKILHIGELGSASSLKLALNMNAALISEALGETLALTRTQGISDETLFEVLKFNVGRSGLSDLKEPKFRARDYSPQFALKHMDKDLRLALETAGKLDLPLARNLKSHYDKGMKQGLGEDDFIGAIRLVDPTK